MKKEKLIVEEKECRRCHKVKKIEEFRTRPSGFTLHQCRQCEGEMGKERRAKKVAGDLEQEVLSIISKSGKTVLASIVPIVGGRITTSPLTDKVLYFNPTVTRDEARVAFSTFAGVTRTGIKFEKV